MTGETENIGSVGSAPGSPEALEELVDELILVEIAGEGEADDRPLGAAYRTVLQGLVTTEMKRDDAPPDLRAVLTAALEKWADTE